MRFPAAPRGGPDPLLGVIRSSVFSKSLVTFGLKVFFYFQEVRDFLLSSDKVQDFNPNSPRAKRVRDFFEFGQQIETFWLQANST